MKRNYKAPEIEIIELTTTDIIQTSAETLEINSTANTATKTYTDIANGTDTNVFK